MARGLLAVVASRPFLYLVEKLMSFNAELPVNLHMSVTRYQLAAGEVVDEFEARQAARYTGMQCRNLAAKLMQLSRGMIVGANPVREMALALAAHADLWTEGMMDDALTRAVLNENARAALVDTDCAIAWDTYSSLNSLGVDVAAAIGEVAKANLLKIDPATHRVKRDAAGKIVTPDGWMPADHHEHLYPLPELSSRPLPPQHRSTGFAELNDD